MGCGPRKGVGVFAFYLRGGGCEEVDVQRAVQRVGAAGFAAAGKWPQGGR